MNPSAARKKAEPGEAADRYTTELETLPSGHRPRQPGRKPNFLRTAFSGEMRPHLNSVNGAENDSAKQPKSHTVFELDFKLCGNTYG